MQAYSPARSIVTDGLLGRPGRFRIDIEDECIERIVPLATGTLGESGGDAPEVADARGKLVLPGFIDSHVHALATARYLQQVDLFGVSSLEGMVERIRGSPQGDADFVMAGRLDRTRLPEARRESVRDALDAAFPRKPVRVASIEGHSSWFNAAAWRRLGVDEVAGKLELPGEDFRSMRDEGCVRGRLSEALADALYDTYSDAEKRSALAQLLDGLPAIGITTLHCLEGYGSDPAHDFKVVLDIASSRDDIDLVLYPRTRDVALARELGLGRIGGCILVDGAIGAHTAAMKQPYADRTEERGILYFADEELAEFARECAQAELQLALHAIGDAALEQVLQVYEGLSGEFDLAALRPRIEHFVAGSIEQFERAAKLGLVSGMQPAFDHFWGGINGAYVRSLGRERGMRTNALATALRAGLVVGGGSDSPITPLDPKLGIYAAANHLNEEQHLSFAQAVELFTSGGASLAFEEDRKGRIEPGFLADMVVMPGDTNESNIHRRPVLLTVKRGRIVHRKGD